MIEARNKGYVGKRLVPQASFFSCVLVIGDYAQKFMTTESAHASPLPEVTRCWDRCRSEEERILKTDLQVLRDEFMDILTFGPLLSSNSDSSSDRLIADNYRQLVRMLRNAVSLEDKLRLLAMWLRQEGILQPREFLPKKIRRTLIKSSLGAFHKSKKKKHPRFRTR